MPKPTIIHPDQSYTFADYFKLNFAPQDLNLYRVPADLEDLLRILIFIINNSSLE